MTTFKSLLFHLKGPLVFHFITDAQSRKTIPTLFNTWQLPGVNYRIYDIEPYVRRVDWIPNGHYASVFAMIKMIIHEILPEDVNEIVYLDTDIVILDDISPMFNVLKNTNESVLFAMGENMSPGYTSGKHPWPARGRGLNAGGLAAFNLERMRRANWTNLWTREAKEHLKGMKRQFGSDQDVHNLLTISHPNIFVRLPCEYNFQLGKTSQPLTCQTNDRAVKIAHFNSKEKLKLKSKYVVHFARYYAQYLNMDGYIFRQRRECDSDKTISTSLTDLAETDLECDELIRSMQTKYRTLLYFNGMTTATPENDVTLVTHLSIHRFHEFEMIIAAWEGPISAALYCTDAELSRFRKYMELSKAFQNRTNVAMHAVFTVGDYYPINYLCNVALNASSTELVYVTETNLVASEGIYNNIRTAVRRNMTKRAFVIPVFEMASDIGQLPTSMQELLTGWNNGRIRPLQTATNQPNYGRWRENTFEIEWNSDYHSLPLVARKAVMRNEEKLIGFDWKDSTNFNAKNLNSYRFGIMPSSFTVQRRSPGHFDQFNVSRLYKKCIASIRREFAEDIDFLKLVQDAIDL